MGAPKRAGTPRLGGSRRRRSGPAPSTRQFFPTFNEKEKTFKTQSNA